MSSREFAAALPEAEGLLCQLTDPIGEELLARAPRLRAISVCAVGYENVDLTATARRGIYVSHTPGVLTEATADHTWALLLAAARRIVEGDTVCRRGRFPGFDLGYLLGSQVSGAILGIVGMGRIGRAVARRAAGFGMTVLCHTRGKARSVREVPMAALLKRSDFVTLHVPGGPATRHLIGRREISMMKRSAILINTSRGSVVDQGALMTALATRRIAAAALDVFEGEPEVPRSLTRLPNVVMTPHVASATIATRRAMAALAARNILAMLLGRPSDATLVKPTL